MSQQDGIAGGIPSTSSGANVVVLSQPEEMVSMATSYHQQPGDKEEIVYDNDMLMKSNLDHEMDSGISDHGLGLG